VTAAGAQVGDSLILTKGFAVEGTALIAKEKGEMLSPLMSQAAVARLAGFLQSPGISVVRDAQIALQVGGVHALHDPTEGGVATGLQELAQAAGVGLVIDEQRLPILPECELLCRHFGLNPLGLIASGALLIASAKDRAPAVVERLRSEGVAAEVIGKVAPLERGCVLRSADQSERPLPVFSRDEIARLFERD
jgi:hydrogenase maturation factor